MDLINGKKYIIIKPYNIRNFFLYCYANNILSVIIEGGKKHWKNSLIWDIGMRQEFLQVQKK